MKKGVLVTAQNFPVIFDRIKKALDGKNLVKTRNVYTKTIKKVNLVINNSTLTSSSRREKGRIITSQQSQFSPISIKIEQSFVWSDNFIAVRDEQGIGHIIINLGNKVCISKGRILIGKHEPSIFGHPSHIVVSQF